MNLSILFCAIFFHVIPFSRAWSHNDGKIVGGEIANLSDYPWQVSLRNFGGGLSHFCGGSILNEYWILTASHCLDGLTPILYNVVAGQQNIHDEDPLEEKRDVDIHFMHPNYIWSEKRNDIGLVKLKDPLVYNDEIQPIDLNDEVIPDHTYCDVTGWGVTSPNGALLSPELRVVSVPTVNDTECFYAYPDDLVESMICAGEPGKDSCSADSGGPMVCETSKGIRLVGVTSFGIGCGNPPWGLHRSFLLLRLDFRHNYDQLGHLT